MERSRRDVMAPNMSGCSSTDSNLSGAEGRFEWSALAAGPAIGSAAMRVTWLPDAEPRPRRVAVGEFDGVHLGHRAVIGDADTVLTFDPHPRAVITPDAAPKLLTPLPIKADLLAGLDVEEMVVIPFDGDFAAQTPAEFVDDILIGRLGAEQVRVGENFRFGHKAKGDVAYLESRSEFTTTVAEMV